VKTKRSISAQTPHTSSQRGGGGLMIWACCATTGPGQLAVIELTMDSPVSILESNVKPFV